MPVSRETESRLGRYAEILVEGSARLALVADSTLPVIWSRHFLDSAQLAPLIPPGDNPVVDMGAGAGFPGLVLAIMGVPNLHLVENNMQKVAFLRRVIAELSLDVVIHAMKVETVSPFVARAVTARALKPLDRLLGHAYKFLGPGSVCVFPKGRRAQQELCDAEPNWRMRVERFASITDPESTIFRLSGIAKAQT